MSPSILLPNSSCQHRRRSLCRPYRCQQCQRQDSRRLNARGRRFDVILASLLTIHIFYKHMHTHADTHTHTCTHMYAFMYLFVCWLFLKYWFLIPDIHSRAHIPKLLPFIFALWQPTRQWTFFSDLWVIFHCHSRLPQGTRALMGYYVKPYKTQSAWKKYVVGFIHLVYLFFCLSACLSIFVSDSFRWRDWYWSIEVLTIDGQDRQRMFLCIYVYI